jgi:hypothetical protein
MCARNSACLQRWTLSSRLGTVHDECLSSGYSPSSRTRAGKLQTRKDSETKAQAIGTDDVRFVSSLVASLGSLDGMPRIGTLCC